MADWTYAPPAAASGWSITPPPDAKGWTITPPEKSAGPDIGSTGLLNVITSSARGLAADVVAGGKKLLTGAPFEETRSKLMGPGGALGDIPQGRASEATGAVASVPGNLISQGVSAASNRVLGPELTKKLTPAAQVAGDVLGTGLGGKISEGVGRVAGAVKGAVRDAPKLAPQWLRPEPEAPPQGTPRGPGPILEVPPTGETVKEAVTRIDDGLDRMRKNNTADKIDASQFLDNVPKEIMSPRVQEQLYTAVEKKLVDPTYEIPPELKPAEEVWKKLADEDNATVDRIRQLDPETGKRVAQSIGPGYVHRIAKDKGSIYDEADPEKNQPDVFGGRNLSTKSPAMYGRKFFVLDDGKARRFIPEESTPKDATPGQKVTVGGRTGVLKHATTEEIEGSTTTRYHKNALINTADSLLRNKRVERNLELLSQLKEQLKASGLGHQTNNIFYDEQGRKITQKGNSDPPPGYQATTLPQFEGWNLHPKIQAVLDDFHNKPGTDLAEALGRINHFLTASMFMTPIPHLKNVGAHWFPSRGWDWINPIAYRNLAVDGARAVKAVLTQDDLYKSYLRDGAGLKYADVAMQNFHKVMIERAGNEMRANEGQWLPVVRQFGFGNVKDAVAALYRASSKALWAGNDIFLLQRQLELERKGVSRRQAIKEAERDIPNYRVPTEIMGQRLIKQALTNPLLINFSRYRYGQFRALSEVTKDLVKGTPEQRTEAMGKVFMTGVMGFILWPIANAALQRMTGNKGAEVTPAGPLSPIEAAYGLSQGERDWASAMGSVMVQSPVVDIAKKGLTGKDFAGRDLVDPRATGLGKAVQTGEAIAGTSYPGELAVTATKPGGLAQAGGQMIGAKIPPRGDRTYKPSKRVIQSSRRRENRDPVEQAIKKVAK